MVYLGIHKTSHDLYWIYLCTKSVSLSLSHSLQLPQLPILDLTVLFNSSFAWPHSPRCNWACIALFCLVDSISFLPLVFICICVCLCMCMCVCEIYIYIYYCISQFSFSLLGSLIYEGLGIKSWQLCFPSNLNDTTK